MSKMQPSIIKWEVKNVHMRALDDQNNHNVSDVLKKVVLAGNVAQVSCMGQGTLHLLSFRV
jgi:hypothetical protein